MTQEQLKENFSTMLAINPPLKEIEELFFKAIKSGAMNYEDEEHDSYRTAKICYHAILCAMADKWLPLVKENRTEAENLIKFI